MRLYVASLLVLSMVGSCQGLWLETYHDGGMWKVPEDTLHALPISLRLNSTDLVHFDPWSLERANLEVTVVPDADWKLDWANRTVQFTVQEVQDGINKSLVFSGYYWGRTYLSFYLTRDDLHPDTNNSLLRDDLVIIVDRKAHLLDTVFIIFGSIFMLVNNVNMGGQLDLHIIWGVLKRPLGPICGFISQFAVMPLITFGMGEVFFSDPLYRLGLFTLGCSPGGIMSNFWTLMFNGDINLSLTMTAISTVAAMGMMPLWFFTLGHRLLHENENIQIPFVNLVGSLVSLTMPVAIGVFIRIKKPAWAELGGRIIKPFTLVVILIFMTLGIYNSYKVFTMMTWQMVGAGLMVSTVGYSLGASLAKLMCLKKPQIVAISIETAFQNAGVSFMLLKLSLPSPDSDLAALPVMAAMMLTGPPIMVVYGVFVFLQRFCGCYPDSQTHHRLPQEECSVEEEGQEKEGKILSKEADMISSPSLEKSPGDTNSRYSIVLKGLTRMKSLEEQKERFQP